MSYINVLLFNMSCNNVLQLTYINYKQNTLYLQTYFHSKYFYDKSFDLNILYINEKLISLYQNWKKNLFINKCSCFSK